MNLKFHSLVLIPSDHCNIQCRHCAPECGPTRKAPWDVELFSRCIEDAARIPSLGRTIHLAGGEPFLYFKDMVAVAQQAQRHGFRISVVTNGFWGVKPSRAREMVRRLKELGLCRVELSTDSFHQEFIDPATIGETIAVLKEQDVPVVLRVVTTRKHRVDETLRAFPVSTLEGIEIVGSPMVPVGRAAIAVTEDERYLSNAGAVGACADLLNLTVRGDGNVAPCCAGSETTPALSMGNAHELPLDVIVRRAEINILLKRLLHQGPASFAPLLIEAGLGHKIKSSYTNICHACSELFNDNEVVAKFRAWAEDVQVDNLFKLLAAIEEIDTGMEFSDPPIEPPRAVVRFQKQAH